MAHLQYIKHENRNYFLITIGMHRLDLFNKFFSDSSVSVA